MPATNEDLIAKLVELAGGVERLEEVLRHVAREKGRTPKIEEVIDYLEQSQKEKVG